MMNDPLKTLPGYVMRRASAAILAALQHRLDRLGLRPTEISVLVLIGANPGITQSALCKALDIQRANMPGLISRLDDRGFIGREQVNGRSQALRLSDDGEKIAKTALDLVTSFEDELIAHIPPDHRDHMLPILNALWQHYSAH
jgi:DNA-binding MarR family transcriptional regulator